jgi:hypothetical protein
MRKDCPKSFKKNRQHHAQSQHAKQREEKRYHYDTTKAKEQT